MGNIIQMAKQTQIEHLQLLVGIFHILFIFYHVIIFYIL